jgi:hypothetical protein
MIIGVNRCDFLKHHQQTDTIMTKCGVLFEVRTEFLTIIWMSFGFKGSNCCSDDHQLSGLPFVKSVTLFASQI